MESRAHDVALLGGGLAGLCLAIQLKRRDPAIDILVAERDPHPPPQAAHKVGESTLEGGAHYFAKVVGLEPYLEAEQLPKSGLRFYFSDDSNEDIAPRPELGANMTLVHRSYQLDRGTFEAKLAETAVELGVHFLDSCTVQDAELGSGDPHTVKLKRQGEEIEVEARWVVDTTGRFGLLKRKLGITKPVRHKANAAWFRVPKKLDMGQWSERPEWQTGGRVANDETRWLATNHIMGYGYWVWFIPLAGEVTSVGIVVDDEVFPISEINSMDKALAWLQEHEPQVHQVVLGEVDDVLDFKFLRHYALNCEQLYSADRWCISGIAGAFHDPLFSFGSDLIAWGNTFTTDLIAREIAGEDISTRADIYNQIQLDTVVETMFTVYQDKFPVMDNWQVFSIYSSFTTAYYWAITANLLCHEKTTDLEFIGAAGEDIQRAVQLMRRMQTFFVEWHAVAGERKDTEQFVAYCCQPHMRLLQEELKKPWTDEQFREKIGDNLKLLEDLATEIFWLAAADLPDPPERRPIDPHAVSMYPQRWEAEGLFDSDREQSSELFDWGSELREFRPGGGRESAVAAGEVG